MTFPVIEDSTPQFIDFKHQYACLKSNSVTNRSRRIYC